VLFLYRYETWPFALREEHWLRVFEYRVLRKIFGPKRVEIIRDWEKFSTEDLHDFHHSPGIQVIRSRIIRWLGHMACMNERRSEYRVLAEKTERDHLETSRHKVLDNIKMDHTEI
jgi:hypothetical protein